MSNEALVRRVTESLAHTSIDDLLKEDETVFLLIDGSSSMNETMKNGKRRIEGLRAVVAEIKAVGHVPMIAFGGPFDAQVRFVDAVPEPEGGTPLHMAIPFAKEYGATRVVVISDGVPDLTEECKIQAAAFGGRIDVVFVGDEGEYGKTFLEELARMTGGTASVGDLTNPKQLGRGIIGLLEGSVEEKAPIQGPGFTTVDTPDVDDDDDFEDEDEEEEDDDDDA